MNRPPKCNRTAVQKAFREVAKLKDNGARPRRIKRAADRLKTRIQAKASREAREKA